MLCAASVELLEAAVYAGGAGAELVETGATSELELDGA